MLREDLEEKYGVLPEYYEDLGGGIYQVYVEAGGKIVPFVTWNPQPAIITADDAHSG